MNNEDETADYPMPWWTPFFGRIWKISIIRSLIMFFMSRSRFDLVRDPKKELLMMPIRAGYLFNAGKHEKAYTLAEKMLRLSPDDPSGLINANAIHAGNLLLGHRALERDDTEAAEAYLLAAANIDEYPYIAGYHGPSFNLADKLLERGCEKVVLKYLQKCKRFWPSGEDVLKHWSNEIKLGKKISMAEEQKRWAEQGKESNE